MLQLRQWQDEKSNSDYLPYVIALCRHYIRLKEPVKLLYAVDQTLHLINFVDLQINFSKFWDY